MDPMLGQIAVPLAVLLLGAIVYLLATPSPHAAKIARMGELAYFVGLLWSVYLVAQHVLKL
jgi:hypothetical protein